MHPFNLFLKTILLSLALLSCFKAEAAQKNDIFDEKMVEGYHRNSKIQLNLAMDALSEYCFVKNEKVLDIGCGDGKITAHIAQCVPVGTVTGLDISKQMIAFAHKTYPPEIYSNLFFIHGDGNDLPYKEEFDSIVSFCCLHWIPNQQRVLTNIYNSLKMGGEFLAVIPIKGDHDIFFLVQALMESEKWKPHFQHLLAMQKTYTRQDYIQLLFDTNFQSSVIKTKVVDTTFNDSQDLIDWLKPLFTSFKNLPEKEQAEFLQDYVDLVMIHYPPNHEGKIIVPACCLNIQAHKLPAASAELE